MSSNDPVDPCQKQKVSIHTKTSKLLSPKKTQILYFYLTKTALCAISRAQPAIEINQSQCVEIMIDTMI